MTSLTRRQALAVGGGAAVALAGFGLWGRFVLGGTFERHVAQQLGLDSDLTDAILTRMRDELGDYELRAAGFLIATEGPSSDVLPAGVRREAIENFVNPMFALSQSIVMPLVYSGNRYSIDYTHCKVLVRGA